MNRLCLGLTIVAASGLGCSTPLEDFVCRADIDCSSKGQQGVCELNSSCSFFDDTCDSGRRFGSASGALSDLCVGAVPDGGAAIDAAAADAAAIDAAADAGVPDAAGPSPLTYTFNNLTTRTNGYPAGAHGGTIGIGLAPTDGGRRFVFVAIMGVDGNDTIALSADSVVLDNDPSGTSQIGIPANGIEGGGGALAGWWWIERPSGTTMEWDMSFTLGGSGFGVASFSVYTKGEGVGIAANYIDETEPMDQFSVDAPAGSVVLACAASTENADNFTSTYFETEHFDVDLNTNEYIAGFGKAEAEGITGQPIDILSTGASLAESSMIVVIAPAP